MGCVTSQPESLAALRSRMQGQGTELRQRHVVPRLVAEAKTGCRAAWASVTARPNALRQDDRTKQNQIIADLKRKVTFLRSLASFMKHDSLAEEEQNPVITSANLGNEEPSDMELTQTKRLLAEARKIGFDVNAFKKSVDAKLQKAEGILHELSGLDGHPSSDLIRDGNQLCEEVVELVGGIRSFISTGFKFRFVRADLIRKWKGGPLPRHQDLARVLGKGCFEEHVFNFTMVKERSHRLDKFLIISHRWVQPGNCDPEGEQLKAVSDYLEAHEEVEWLWMDWLCLPQKTPQGPRPPQEETYFRLALQNMHLLFLSLHVLIIFDRQYYGRFWTSFETYLSTHQATEEGLLPLPESQRRCSVVCLGGTSEKCRKDNEAALMSTWASVTVDEAIDSLNQDDILVTNTSDKTQQIKVLANLEETVAFLGSLPEQDDNNKEAADPPQATTHVRKSGCLEEVVEDAAKQLQGLDGRIRCAAARCLGNFGAMGNGDVATAVLDKAAMEDPNEEVRIEASKALRKVTSELDSNDNARQLLSDSATWELRQEAAQRLGILGAGAVRHTGTLARAALKDPCGDVRGAAAEALLAVTAALGKAAKPQHAKDVAELLHAPEQSVAVQQQAADFLGAHREALMMAASKAPSLAAQTAAAEALRELGSVDDFPARVRDRIRSVVSAASGGPLALVSQRI